MDSKKRKEKILKKINKERSFGATAKSVSPKSTKDAGNNRKVTEKRPMYSNEKALKEEKLKNKIFKEKDAYQKQKMNPSTNPVGQTIDKGIQKLKAVIKKIGNKMRGMSPQARYKMIGAWVVCILVVIVIAGIIISSIGSNNKKSGSQSAKGDTKASGDATTEEVNENPLTACNNEAVTTLITNYITALRDVNLDAMKALDVYQETYNNEANFKNTASVIEDYRDITIYTKNGPYENGFMTYVVTNIKFKNIDKTCQGMLQYVVRLQEDGSYKIDTTPEDDIEDDDISNALTALSQSEDVLTLIDSVNQQCAADIAADEKLKAYVEGTLENGSSAAGMNPDSQATEATTEQAAEGAATTEGAATKGQ